jgi:hypothetical protein
MKKLLFPTLFVAFVALAACKKSFDAELTYRKKPLAGIWAKQEPFYAPQGEFFNEATSSWRSFIGFSFTSEDDPNKLGFYNPYVPGRGTNALGMRTIYASQTLTNDSGFYTVQIPKCFEFIPDGPDAVQGTVNVIPQRVKCVRTNRSEFFIGIRGTGGRYNEITKTFEIDITFDETEISGPAAVVRKYRFRP